jgi:hypothetical protein
MFGFFKKIWTTYVEYEKDEMDKAIESCWYCLHRDKGAAFERFRCKKKMVWVDGRGIVGIILGVHPWDEYEMDALKVKGYRCKKWELDKERLLKSKNYKHSRKYRQAG